MRPLEVVTQVFAYGTLMRGQSRERRWPFAPREVRPATTRGTLYDLGPYPAMAEGDDWISGEVWSFEAHQMQETLRVLDGIEDVHGMPGDLYLRLLVECVLEDGRRTRSHAYQYARPLDESNRVECGTDGLARWPAGQATDGF